ncbi:MAG: helix-turn-helix domain-containing protein [Aigarchaeota archaeon]|nr:helix-turn-helix domain-containing protein [Aigarchaeota archaeon]MDW8093233.1 helix-turn-helix domain-containing protein [Nitrososphaerota archaeon]
MILPSELEAKTTIPLIRSILARRLIEDHGFTQQQVAKALGITQAAVSNYIRGARGHGCAVLGFENDKRFTDMIDGVISAILTGEGEIEVSRRISECLLWLRRSKSLCDYHKQLEPTLDVERCTVCDV